MYSSCIIQKSSSSNYSLLNQRDLVLDTAENLTQIGTWARGNFTKDKPRIELFLRLTRKNLNALLGFPLSPSFDHGFQKVCHSFSRLEEEYASGIADHGAWAAGMFVGAALLTQSVQLI